MDPSTNVLSRLKKNAFNLIWIDWKWISDNLFRLKKSTTQIIKTKGYFLHGSIGKILEALKRKRKSTKDPILSSAPSSEVRSDKKCSGRRLTQAGREPLNLQDLFWKVNRVCPVLSKQFYDLKYIFNDNWVDNQKHWKVPFFLQCDIKVQPIDTYFLK